MPYPLIPRRAYAYFRQHGEPAQSAARLARAEAWADTYGYTTEWDWDDLTLAECWEDHDSQCPEARREAYEYHGRIPRWPNAPHEHEILSCRVRDPDGRTAAACGGIVDPDRHFGRFMEADLLAEVREEIMAERAREGVPA